MPAENHLLGAKDPEYLFATLQQPPTLICDSTLKGNKMNAENQTVNSASSSVRGKTRPLYVVGMDAHSRKLAVSIWECSDPWDPKFIKRIPNFEVSSMVKTYERRIPRDSITIIEATTNAFYLKQQLDDAGFQSAVVKSDTIAGKVKKRKICDNSDADALALAYIHGDIKEFVWSPTTEYAQYREIYFAYRDCQKDLVRAKQRVWSICSQNGQLAQLGKRGATVANLREILKSETLDDFTQLRLEFLLDDCERYDMRREMLKELMAKCVLRSQSMLDLMQLPGVNYRTAFVTVAFIGDARRFLSAAKMVAYAALAPMVNTSGEEEKRAQKRGGSGKPLDNEGRHDLKFFYGEAAQTVLSSYADTALGKWGWHLLYKGKSRNEVVCAVARKLITYAWHILRGDPTPNRECEASYIKKLDLFCKRLKLLKEIKKQGYKTCSEFITAQVDRIYSGLPPVNVETSA